jgi:hypothetical protein
MTRSKQFYLHRKRQIGYFIEEQGAIAGALDEAGLVVYGTREAALAMTKELAFDEFRGDCPAVHRDKGAVGTRPAVMNQASDQLLARAGLA